MPQPERVGFQSGAVFGAQSTSGAAGTHQHRGNSAIVTYDTGLLDDPVRLVATLVHELAHDPVLPVASQTPGGEDLHELATDLATVHLGLGPFGANAAFEFYQFNDGQQQGWGSSRSGYFSEAFWGFANALFMELRAIPATSYVKDSVARQIAKNRAYHSTNPDIVASIRAAPSAP